MPGMQQQGPAPYKKDTVETNNEFEVLENGDIKVISKTTLHVFWKSRDFLSLIRQNEKALENNQHHLTDEYKEKINAQIAEIQKELDQVKPIYEDAEKKSIAHFEKTRREGLAKNVAEAVNAEKIKEDWFQNVWLRVKEDVKKDVLELVSNDDRAKLATILTKLKRKGIQ